MEKKPSLSSTKAEILAAYNDLLKKKSAENDKIPKDEKLQEQKDEIIKSAAEFTPQDIVKELTDVKLKLSGSLDALENALLYQYNKLEKLQKAIQYESAYLEDLYGIKANAESLAVIIAANKEKKQAFDKEVEEKKSAWEKEQKERIQQWKEEDELRKKALQREAEEYKYQLTISRKKEEDEYQSKKIKQENELEAKRLAVEKNLEEREKLISEKEDELKHLRIQVADMPEKIRNEVTFAIQQKEQELVTQYKHEKEIYTKEMEGEIKLLQQKISSLENKINEQAMLIETLNEKANTAGNQVQNIALKALESAASFRMQPMEKRDEKEK